MASVLGHTSSQSLHMQRDIVASRKDNQEGPPQKAEGVCVPSTQRLHSHRDETAVVIAALSPWGGVSSRMTGRRSVALEER